MERTYPSYYKDFRCLAGSCPDSCCKEWDVDVDPVSAAYYRSLPGDLGDRLRQVLKDTEDGTVMTIEEGRCPMWRQDGLCRIQAELGHDGLCQVCRQFPRLRHDYGNFEELGLELSCPEAARLILTSAAQDFVTETAEGGEAPEYDEEAMAVLCRTRKDALALLADTGISVPRALAILLLYGYEVQAELDGGSPAILNREKAMEDACKFAGAGEMSGIFAFFRDLEILTDRWRALLDRPGKCSWQEIHRALARYFVQRYWLQAVSDYDLIGRVKFAVIGCLLVSAMDGEPVQLAQLFSKEIENDADNVEAILDGAYTAPALTDAALLGLLMK